MADKLLWGIKNGELEEVKKIIEDQKNLVKEMISGRYPLHYAADYGQVDVARYLIEKGADVNEKDKHGITPLLTAVFEGHRATVELLISKGAKKDSVYEGKKIVELAEDEQIKAMLKK